MKKHLLVALVGIAFAASAMADIQDPPGNDYGPTRKLGRGTGITGLFEIFTFPFPVWRDSYRPVLPSDIPYIHAGYSEFPPELGNESKYPYCRDY